MPLAKQCPVAGCFKDHLPTDVFCSVHGQRLKVISPPLIDSGTIIAGKYRIVACIGSGGMGELYRAVQEKPHQEVAIKILHPEHMEDHAERFLAEAEKAARVKHPNCVAIHATGETDQGLLYIAMEFIPGRDLSELITIEGPKSDLYEARSWTLRSLRIVRQIAEVLDVAHNLSPALIHRDIKPSNIRLWDIPGSRDFVKLLDFGIAKELGATGFTRTGQNPGTPAYISPEQVEGGEIDARTDLYSLGVVLYEMLSGQRPFQGRSDYDTAWMRVRLHAPPLSELNPNVPDEVEALVSSLLEKEPVNRPQSAVALRARVDNALTSLSAPNLTSAAIRPDATTEIGRPALVVAPRPVGLWKKYALYVVGTAAFLAGMIATGLLSSSPDSPEVMLTEGIADTLPAETAAVAVPAVDFDSVLAAQEAQYAAKARQDSIRYAERYRQDSARLAALALPVEADNKPNDAPAATPTAGTTAGSQPIENKAAPVTASAQLDFSLAHRQGRKFRFTVPSQGSHVVSCPLPSGMKLANGGIVIRCEGDSGVGGCLIEPDSPREKLWVTTWRLLRNGSYEASPPQVMPMRERNELEVKYEKSPARIIVKVNKAGKGAPIDIDFGGKAVQVRGCSPFGDFLIPESD